MGDPVVVQVGTPATVRATVKAEALDPETTLAVKQTGTTVEAAGTGIAITQAAVVGVTAAVAVAAVEAKLVVAEPKRVRAGLSYHPVATATANAPMLR